MRHPRPLTFRMGWYFAVNKPTLLRSMATSAICCVTSWRHPPPRCASFRRGPSLSFPPSRLVKDALSFRLEAAARHPRIGAPRGGRGKHRGGQRDSRRSGNNPARLGCRRLWGGFSCFIAPSPSITNQKGLSEWRRWVKHIKVAPTTGNGRAGRPGGGGADAPCAQCRSRVPRGAAPKSTHGGGWRGQPRNT